MMILPDVNVLIYAFRKDVPEHATCNPWLTNVVAAHDRFGLSPLALNALVLCPIIIRRALRAGREGGNEGQAGITASSLMVAIVLLVLTLIYFLLLLKHNI